MLAKKFPEGYGDSEARLKPIVVDAAAFATVNPVFHDLYAVASGRQLKDAVIATATILFGVVHKGMRVPQG